MTRVERAVQAVRHPLAFRVLQVRRTTRLTPLMMRVTVAGEQLAGFHSPAADDHVTLYFPNPGENSVPIPEVGANGLTFARDAAHVEHRDYTPRRHDPAAGELDIDFVLHGSGPAASWAATAEPGRVLGVAGPRGSFVVPDDLDWHLLAGDETALPAIARRLEALPAGSRAIAFVEVADAAEEQVLRTAADLDLTWLHRNGAPAGSAPLLADAVRALDFPAGSYYAWAAGESGCMRPLRQYLARDRALTNDRFKVQGYWKRPRTP